MHTYPVNSPMASARVMGLTLLADGHVGNREWALARAWAQESALSPQQWDALLQQLCESVWDTPQPVWPWRPEPWVEAVIGEIQDPHLQALLLTRCEHLAWCDGWLSDTESAWLQRLASHWPQQQALRTQFHA